MNGGVDRESTADRRDSPEAAARRREREAHGLSPEGGWPDALLQALVPAVAAAVMVFGLVLLAETTVGTEQRDGRVTDKRQGLSRVRATGATSRADFSVIGIDENGDGFRIEVDRYAYGNADIGQTVEIERSLLTGRVVSIDGPGWQDDSGGVLVGMLAAGLGGVGLVFTVVFGRRHVWPTATFNERRRLVAALVGLTTVGAVLALWAGFRYRPTLEVGDGLAATAAPATTVPATTSPTAGDLVDTTLDDAATSDDAVTTSAAGSSDEAASTCGLVAESMLTVHAELIDDLELAPEELSTIEATIDELDVAGCESPAVVCELVPLLESEGVTVASPPTVC